MGINAERVRQAPTKCIEIAEFTQILPFAAEGTAFPKLAGRSDDRPAQTGWAFGLQELQPSFPPSLGKNPVHHFRSFKVIFRGMPHAL